MEGQRSLSKTSESTKAAGRPENRPSVRAPSGVVHVDFDGSKIQVASSIGLEQIVAQVCKDFQLQPGSFTLNDAYGEVEDERDLSRALCEYEGPAELKVHLLPNWQKLRFLEEQVQKLAAKDASILHELQASESRVLARLETVRDELSQNHGALSAKVSGEVVPTMESLMRDNSQLKAKLDDVKQLLETIDFQFIQEVGTNAAQTSKLLESNSERVSVLEASWEAGEKRLSESYVGCKSELEELRRWLQGKMNVLVKADADLRGELQLALESTQMLSDDLGLLKAEMKTVEQRCNEVFNEGDAMANLVGSIREDMGRVKSENQDFQTRVGCLEGSASEKWRDFYPGVVYFKRWHKSAKGSDVQLSPDLSVATARGFASSAGVVVGSSEGLVLADGPCRKFGTDNSFHCYYEVEVVEVTAVPAGAGGLLAGVTLQRPAEVAGHPRYEFDGWLLGGQRKALICRAGAVGGEEEERGEAARPQSPAFSATRRGTKPTPLPRGRRGEWRQVDSTWLSEGLKAGDIVGVNFTLRRAGSARLRVLVNGTVQGEHDFHDAPPADHVGHLTPVLRLAGSAKSVKLRAPLTPPARALVGD